MADVWKEFAVKRLDIACLERLNFPVHIGMTPNCTLSKDHQGSCEDIGAFCGNDNRCPDIAVSQQVAGAAHNRDPAEDIHPVVNDLSVEFREIGLGNRGGDGGFHPRIQRATGVASGGFHQVDKSTHSC